MTKEELLDLLNDIEWEDIEFKKSENQLPTSVWQTVSAFSNSKGGHIVFGVDEKDGQIIITGVQNPEKIQSDFLTTLRGQKFNTALSAKSEKYNIDGKIVLVFYIPEMPRQSKPIYYGGEIKNSFIRYGSTDQRCTQEEIQRMIREASEQSSDSMIVEGYTLDDLEKETIKKYRNFLSSFDPTSPLLGLSDFDFLKRIGAYSSNRVQKKEGITLGGLLLFGKSEAILERLPNFENQYFYLDATQWGVEQRWDDRLVSQQNLVETFLLMMDKIKRHMDSPFFMRDTQRQENLPVMIAIREALVNLLIHQDYFERQIAQIRHFKNSITFINPGTSQIQDIDELYSGDLTAPRNPVIAKAFRLIGWAEVAGTGLLKILRSWQEMGFELPKIENDFKRYQFSITLSQQHLIDDEDKKWLSQFPDLSDQEKLILIAAKKYGNVTNGQIRLLLGIGDTLFVSQMLSKLCDSKKPYLVKIGTKGPSVRYELHDYLKDAKANDKNIHNAITSLKIGPREKEILTFCLEAKSTVEILEFLNLKDREYLRTEYLKPLLDKHYLKMTFEEPTHPKQTYFTDKEFIFELVNSDINTE